ncbi:prohormone-1-like [Ornithodoros turicata]|uniref:prohormone-1-like n=1 Tax=Ornithodoros turicata TaxID=34597 RepID=UPI00313914BE
MKNSLKTGYRLRVFFPVLLLLIISSTCRKCRGATPLCLVEESGNPGSSGNLDNLLLNYLFAKQMARRVQQRDLEQSMDFQRKRSGWRQCAFNAVSCFGRRK